MWHMQFRSLKDVRNLKGKRVLVRVDFNVPVFRGKIEDDFRIEKGLPTLRHLLRQGARIVVVTHRGRPKGFDRSLSLRSIAQRLEVLLGRSVPLVSLNSWDTVAARAKAVEPGAAIMLENIRYLADEETNSGTLAKDLASLADLFVLDGFAVAHRAAASVSGVAKFLPSYAGLLLSEEIEGLTRVMDQPKKPLVVILGGAKADTKIPVLKHLLSKADHILVSGGIVNTYLWAKGFKVGKSFVTKDARAEILRYCKSKKVVLPVDFIAGTDTGAMVRHLYLNKQFRIKPSEGLFDIGPATVRLFAGFIKQARTIIFNGAPGMFEVPPYQFGTRALTQIFAARSRGPAFGVCGGGETVQVVQSMDVASQIDLVSTGGGAMLEFLSGKKLPGIVALQK